MKDYTDFTKIGLNAKYLNDLKRKKYTQHNAGKCNSMGFLFSNRGLVKILVLFSNELALMISVPILNTS